MFNTKIRLISIITILFSFTFVGCADKTPAESSYENDSAIWQQNKSKQAVDNIDK